MGYDGLRSEGGKSLGPGARMRFEILKRDHFACHYCGNHPPIARLVIDHKVPRSAGGKTALDSLVAACTKCNEGKGRIALDDDSFLFREAATMRLADAIRDVVLNDPQVMRVFLGAADEAKRRVARELGLFSADPEK